MTPTARVRIRPYAPGDDAGIRAVHDWTPPAGSPPGDTPQRWAEDLERIAGTFVAFAVAEAIVDGRDTIVGMAGLVVPGDDVPDAVLAGGIERRTTVRLTRMRILPAWQRQGIGMRLVEALIAWAREHGIQTMILETTADQAAAVALYRRCGFVEATRSVWHEWELVWMRRSVG